MVPRNFSSYRHIDIRTIILYNNTRSHTPIKNPYAYRYNYYLCITRDDQQDICDFEKKKKPTINFIHHRFITVGNKTNVYIYANKFVSPETHFIAILAVVFRSPILQSCYIIAVAVCCQANYDTFVGNKQLLYTIRQLFCYLCPGSE